jgi:hypothetical protein
MLDVETGKPGARRVFLFVRDLPRKIEIAPDNPAQVKVISLPER